MPYIKQEARKRLADGEAPQAPGEINYLFYQSMLKAWKVKPSYDTVHDILHCKREALQIVSLIASACPKCLETGFTLAFMEFYRRKVVPYEERKIVENGDIEV